MVSFTSSVTSVVNKRSLLPTQLNDGNLKDKTYYPADFSSLVTLSLSLSHHEGDDSDGGEDEGVPVLGHEAGQGHDAVFGEEQLAQGQEGAQRINLMK